jgi:hypothetical protein
MLFCGLILPPEDPSQFPSERTRGSTGARRTIGRRFVDTLFRDKLRGILAWWRRT